ncbi:MAG: helix-turn-helix domain-containing protein [Candidatus Brocadiae bacterium]|nr:helix-turn-helix domain-containing protein [Candidatus Brocadiia bacterium]
MLTASELANRLQCSERTIWRMVRKGLPAHRISDRLVRFDAIVVDDWLKNQRRVEPD